MKQRRYTSEPVTKPTPRDQQLLPRSHFKPVRNLTTCYITKYHHSETCLEQKLVSSGMSLFRQRKGKTFCKPASNEPAETGQHGNKNSCRNQRVNIGRVNFFNVQYYRVLGPTTPTKRVELSVSHCKSCGPYATSW